MISAAQVMWMSFTGAEAKAAAANDITRYTRAQETFKRNRNKNYETAGHFTKFMSG